MLLKMGSIQRYSYEWRVMVLLVIQEWPYIASWSLLEASNIMFSFYFSLREKFKTKKKVQCFVLCGTNIAQKKFRPKNGTQNAFLHIDNARAQFLYPKVQNGWIWTEKNVVSSIFTKSFALWFLVVWIYI